MDQKATSIAVQNPFRLPITQTPAPPRRPLLLRELPEQPIVHLGVPRPVNPDFGHPNQHSNPNELPAANLRLAQPLPLRPLKMIYIHIIAFSRVSGVGP
jgi:hypothetical protein